jgi:hypothetical protein
VNSLPTVPRAEERIRELAKDGRDARMGVYIEPVVLVDHSFEVAVVWVCLDDQRGVYRAVYPVRDKDRLDQHVLNLIDAMR